jgi:hypothetical protein
MSANARSASSRRCATFSGPDAVYISSLAAALRAEPSERSIETSR